MNTSEYWPVFTRIHFVVTVLRACSVSQYGSYLVHEGGSGGSDMSRGYEMATQSLLIPP